MPFRPRQNLSSHSVFVTNPIVGNTDSEGNVIDSYRESKPLPPVENFRLGNLLKAGVPLDEVNTKILGASSVDLSSLASKSSDSSKTEADDSSDSKEN